MSSRSVTGSKILLLLFFVSGSCGLIYEIIWMRLLGYVFGNTVYAASTVLAVFMGGLALGSFGFGKLSDRYQQRVRLYGLLELLIGVYALLLPLVIGSITPIYKYWYENISTSPALLTLARFVLSSLVLLPPTVLMGGTLPLLIRHFSQDRENLGFDTGRLYAINTFGAVTGVLLGGFLLLPGVGMRNTTLIAAGINILIGVACVLWIQPRSNVAESHATAQIEATAIETSNSALFWLVMFVFLASGFIALSHEVAWTRVLTLVFGPSTYAFSIMLSGFITGIAVGSVIMNKIKTKPGSLVPTLGWLQLLSGAMMLLAILFIPKLFSYSAYLNNEVPKWFEHSERLKNYIDQSFYVLYLLQFLMVFAVLLIPTMMSGMVFPLLARLINTHLKNAGGQLGLLYAGNTTGSVLGSLACGFFFIPWLGIQKSLRLGIAASILLGFVVFAFGIMYRNSTNHSPIRIKQGVSFAVISLIALIGVALMPTWNISVLNSAPYIYGSVSGEFEEDIRFYEEGIDATVAVQQFGDHLALRIEGKTDASSGGTILEGDSLEYGDMRTQVMIAHLGLFLHPNPENVLLVGLASGVSAGAISQHDRVKSFDVIEISKSVVRATAYFKDVNHDVLNNPKVHLHNQDGRNFLKLTNTKYDVVVSEPTNPSSAGAAKLFTTEFLTDAKNSLKDDGVFVQWVQAYRISLPVFQSFVRTFTEVFPHTSLWLIHGSSDLALVGSKQPLYCDPALIKRIYDDDQKVHDDVWKVGVMRWEEIPGSCIATDSSLRRESASAIVNTDDNSFVEYSAPKMFRTEERDRIFEWLEKLDVNLPEIIAPKWLNTPEAESIQKAIETRRLFLVKFAVNNEEWDQKIDQQVIDSGYFDMLIYGSLMDRDE